MATAYDIIQVSVRSNDSEFPLITVACGREWHISRVKQEIESKHPKHIPIDVQVIYFNGVRLEDTIVLFDIFKPKLVPDSPNPFHTLWLANISENKVIQEFISLPKSNISPSESHPYHSAVQYYNYIRGDISKNTNTNRETEQNQTDRLAANAGDRPVNPQREGNQEGEEFNFLGGRPQGIGFEEEQEQNAIINAITLMVKLTLLLYITYQFAPQYKFYLVIAFSGIMFLHQLGVFRVNRVNIPRFQVVENQIRAREDNLENQETVREPDLNENKSDKPVEEEPVKHAATDEINIASEQNGIQAETVSLTPTEQPPHPGVLSSLTNLLYNLLLSFHPEYNAQV